MSRAECKVSETMRSLTMECMTYCSLLKQQAGLLTAALPVKEMFVACTLHFWAVRHDVDDKLARYPTLAVLCIVR